MSKNAELMSTAPSCFVRDTCPRGMHRKGMPAVKPRAQAAVRPRAHSQALDRRGEGLA